MQRDIIRLLRLSFKFDLNPEVKPVHRSLPERPRKVFTWFFFFLSLFQVLRNRLRVNSTTLSSNQHRGSPQSKNPPNQHDVRPDIRRPIAFACSSSPKYPARGATGAIGCHAVETPCKRATSIIGHNFPTVGDRVTLQAVTDGSDGLCLDLTCPQLTCPPRQRMRLK